MPKLIQSSIVPARLALPAPKVKSSVSELKHLLNQQSHLLIVSIATCIGAIFAIFIAYTLHLQPTLINIAALCLVPIALALSLRKVYIHTLLNMEYDD
ncbi:hypothetical protein B9T33_14400 [Acinetobacter sp. ANC 5054]|uniref:hypothetical protein n=1 Tax=Acinetobacter sp. ANC 5054 TaxID=1977877 RepID=UPI000A334325|nr:hypothetical protein [Acinetobacter sp. ANC 5054]OTG77982.1 hypothetical protein B9T33_14400 [Acinetobacter sp. ANC 5054]